MDTQKAKMVRALVRMIQTQRDLDGKSPLSDWQEEMWFNTLMQAPDHVFLDATGHAAEVYVTQKMGVLSKPEMFVKQPPGKKTKKWWEFWK